MTFFKALFLIKTFFSKPTIQSFKEAKVALIFFLTSKHALKFCHAKVRIQSLLHQTKIIIGFYKNWAAKKYPKSISQPNDTISDHLAFVITIFFVFVMFYVSIISVFS